MVADMWRSSSSRMPSSSTEPAAAQGADAQDPSVPVPGLPTDILLTTLPCKFQPRLGGQWHACIRTSDILRPMSSPVFCCIEAFRMQQCWNVSRSSTAPPANGSMDLSSPNQPFRAPCTQRLLSSTSWCRVIFSTFGSPLGKLCKCWGYQIRKPASIKLLS